VQPGTGGRFLRPQDPSTEGSTFTRAIPILFGGIPNGVDAAIGSGQTGTLTRRFSISGESQARRLSQRSYGSPENGPHDLLYDRDDHGSCRQTLLRITYGPGKVATFRNQIKIGTNGFSSAGDSGIANRNARRELTPARRSALLCCGSALDDSFTLANPISKVLTRLSVAMTGR